MVLVFLKVTSFSVATTALASIVRRNFTSGGSRKYSVALPNIWLAVTVGSGGVASGGGSVGRGISGGKVVREGRGRSPPIALGADGGCVRGDCVLGVGRRSGSGSSSVTVRVTWSTLHRLPIHGGVQDPTLHSPVPPRPMWQIPWTQLHCVWHVLPA